MTVLQKYGFKAAIVASLISMSMGMAAGSAMAQEAATPSLSFDAVLTTDVMSNARGGVSRGTRALANLDLSVAWTGTNGWEAFGYVIADAGGGFSEKYSADSQVVSNIDAPPAVRLFEAYVRKTSADEKFVTTFGLMNINGIFDVQEVGGAFLNSSHGLGADYAQSGPSIFPITGLGLVSEWRIKENLRLRGGVFDGVAGDPDHISAFAPIKLGGKDGVHYIVELEKDFDGGFVKLGHWGFSAPADRIDGLGTSKANQGSYAQLSLSLVREKTDGKDSEDQGLRGWLRYGAANEKVMELDRYVGGGLVYTGLLKGRDHDLVGLSVAQAHYGKSYKASVTGPTSTETTFEATYQYEVRPGFVIQPDVQYVKHPSGRHDIKDALVFGIRFRIGLEALKA